MKRMEEVAFGQREDTPGLQAKATRRFDAAWDRWSGGFGRRQGARARL